MNTAQIRLAKEFAVRGVRVVPQRRDKRGAAPKWPDIATVDHSQIDKWATHEYPSWNFAAVAGQTSGVIVIDVDCHDGSNEGPESFAKLEAEHGKIDTYKVMTPSGGWHLWFKHPGGEVPTCTIAAGVEVLSDKHLVTLPGSLSGSHGAEYRVVQDGEFASCPEWLPELARTAKKPKQNTRKGLLPGNEADPDASNEIPEGQRNAHLASIAGTFRTRNLSFDALLAALLAENEKRCQPPLPSAEVRSIAESISQYPLKQENMFTRTDSGNADWMVYLFGQDMRYVHLWKKWLIWDGRYWKEDVQNAALMRARETARHMYELAFTLEPKQRAILSDWALRSLNLGRLKPMTEIAKSLVPIQPEQLDIHHMLLGVQNGIVDLETGKLTAFDRLHYITKEAPVIYDDMAACPRWLSFLDVIFEGNKELISFIQRAIGYSLTGSVREQCFFILVGSGDNGKSTMLETIQTMLGDYANETAPETLMQSDRRSGQATPELAAVQGVRFLSSIETGEGKKLDEARIKGLTGGDTVVARRLYAEYFTFDATFKLFLATNHLPAIHGTDWAIWRRIRRIPFNYQVPKDDQDSELKAKLETELPGILQWAIQGCLEWQERGLDPPRDVISATNEYRDQMDVLADFLSDCVAPANGITAEKKQVYRAYERWCKENGEKPMTQRTLSGKLQERGYTETRTTGGTRCWEGILLTQGAYED